MNSMVLDLEECNEGMSCEEFTTLMIAGVDEIPPEVWRRMDEHEIACPYHRSSDFNKSALGTPVTPEIEQAAREIISKYTEEEEE